MKTKLNSGFVLLSVILMDLLTGVELDLFVPSFPEVQAHFELTTFWVEALLSVNFIGYCLSLFFVGGLADYFGRRPIILLGLGTFVLGSLLCVYAPTIQLLLLGRFLQGVGIAAPAILSFLIIADTYPLKRQQFLFAILNGSMNTAVALAPVIGSYISLYFHWRANFTALLLLGLFTLVVSIFSLPAYALPRQKQALSLKGYLEVLESRHLMLLIITLVMIFSPYWIFVGMSPLLYMKALGVSLTHFGYYQGVLALVFAVGSIGYGLILHRYSEQRMLYLTLGIYIFSSLFILMLVLNKSASPLLITLAMLSFVIGQIIPSTILYPQALNYIPQAKGRASAVLQGLRLLFTSFCLQLAGYLYQGSFPSLGLMLLMTILLASACLFMVIR